MIGIIVLILLFLFISVFIICALILDSWLDEDDDSWPE